MGTYKTVKVKRNGKTVTKRLYVPSSKSSSSKSSSSSSKSSSGGSSSSSSSNIDYNFYADRETAEQYNARIAAARGDSAESLANMQNTTKQTFANAGLNYQALPTTTAPTNVGDVQPFDNTYLPDVSPYVPGITNATAGMAGLSDYAASQQAMIEREEQRRLAAEQDNQKQTQSLIDRLLGNIRTPDEARTQAIRETGIDPEEYFAEQRAGIKEIEKLTEEYNAVKAARDQQLAQTQDKMASMSFINNQQAQIERNAAPRLNEISANINAKAATLEALQGNYAQARQFINEAVAAATADAKFKFDMFSTFYSLNQDAFERTESIYREAYETSLNAAENEYNRQREEKLAMAELILKYPSAGININSDSIFDAYEKASLVAPTGSGPDLTADMRNYNAAVDQGYTGTFAEWLGKEGGSFGYTEVMQAAIDDGASPEGAARAAALVSERDGIPVDQATLSSWTRYAGTLSPTPNSAPRVSDLNTVSSYGNAFSSLADQLFGD